MKKITALNLTVIDSQDIVVPGDAELLKVDVIEDKPVLVVLGDTEAEQKAMTIRMIATDADIAGETRGLEYINTFQMGNGDVWHAFEARNY